MYQQLHRLPFACGFPVDDANANPFGPPRLLSAEEMPWVDHEERGKWVVKIGDDFRWYLSAEGRVQIGAHWFDDQLSAQQAIEKYRDVNSDKADRLD